MKYRKVNLSNWFKDAFHCVVENIEFDETAQIWKNPLDVKTVYSRMVEYNETNPI